MQYVTVPAIGSSKYNAVCMPNGVIAVTYGLKNLLTEEELEAVLLHEKGHKEGEDAQITMIIACIMTILWVIVLKKKGYKKSIMFNYLGMIPTAFLNWGMELNADAYVVAHGNGEDLISALEKIDAANHMNVWWKQAIGSLKHPPTTLRAMHIREEIASLNGGK